MNIKELIENHLDNPDRMSDIDVFNELERMHNGYIAAPVFLDGHEGTGYELKRGTEKVADLTLPEVQQFIDKNGCVGFILDDDSFVYLVAKSAMGNGVLDFVLNGTPDDMMEFEDWDTHDVNVEDQYFLISLNEVAVAKSFNDFTPEAIGIEV